jgi:hypothetical protein
MAPHAPLCFLFEAPAPFLAEGGGYESWDPVAGAGSRALCQLCDGGDDGSSVRNLFMENCSTLTASPMDILHRAWSGAGRELVLVGQLC